MCPSSTEETSRQSPISPADTDLTALPSPSYFLRPTSRQSRTFRPARLTPSPTGSRRSVSSMKSLMPLALSPSNSSLWSSSSAEEPVGERVDDYFPELLARDLELSTRVFTSKRMTAGMPISTLSLDDTGRQRSCRMMPSLPYLAASARVQSLGPIEERSSSSRVSFLNPQGLPVLDDTSSDLDSRSTAQASEDTIPPSIRPRESFMTMATSLASTNWKPSIKSPARGGGARESSWIDGDSDGEGHDDDDGMRRSNMGSPTPRPPTPPESDRESGVPGGKIDLRGHWGYNEAPLHRKSHSVSGSSPTTSRRRLSCASVDVPLRPASTAGVRGNEARESMYGRVPPSLLTPNVFSKQEEFRPRQPRRSTGGSLTTNKKSFHVNVVTEPSPVSEDYSDLEDELMTPPRLQQPYHPLSSHPVEIAPPPPRPPLRNVQSWLNGSLQPLPRSLQNEDLTKVVPLPPDAMETLRVSIACFPETMLLSSSLTIETIRTYSRKVRQPSIELFRNLPIRSPSPESPTQASKKSLWRKVVPYKKGWDAPEPKQRHHHSGANSIDSSTSCSLSPPKPWESLKHIFGCYSDYICDALYAHILAYNYIAALVSRNPQPLQKVQRGASVATRDSQQSQQEEIPKKAASLLGLAGAGDATSSSFSRLTRRLGTPLGSWTKEEMITTQPSSSANHENMLQGLLKCISRLVSTAKLVAETGSADETTIKEEVEEMDMLFVRSLCEIVRMAEEAS